MSWKKKKSKKKGRSQWWLLIIGILFIGILIWLLYSKVLNQGESYSIESRVSNVEDYEIEDENYEAIGWLRVQGTDIDYPIILGQSDKDEEFPVELDNFVWTLNLDREFHNRVRIMGHNIFNLSSKPKLSSDSFSRFEQLMSFVYYDFASENEYIQYTVDGKDYLYKIFMAGFVPSYETVWFPIGDDYSKEEMNEYIDILEKYNLYDYDIDVAGDDKVITLATCTRFFGLDKDVEFMVAGRLVREDEKIHSYKVTKNHENYDEIEKILKGDDEGAEDDA